MILYALTMEASWGHGACGRGGAWAKVVFQERNDGGGWEREPGWEDKQLPSEAARSWSRRWGEARSGMEQAYL